MSSVAGEATRDASPFRPETARELVDSLLTDDLLALDRRSNRGLVSVAGTGFLAAALVELDPERVGLAERLHASLELLAAANPAANGGWFSHFTDTAGRPLVGSEVSTIDTALLLLGHRLAAQRLGDNGYLATVERLRRELSLPLVSREGLVSHGFTWQDSAGQPVDHAAGTPTAIEHLWNDTSEGVLVYWLVGDRLLAEGLRDDWWQPAIVRDDYPLFVYAYPLALVPAVDHPAALEQADRWRAMLEDALHYQNVAKGVVGLTATDGPDRYEVDSPTLVAPILLASLADWGLPHVREMLHVLRDRGVDSMTPGYDFVEPSWRPDDAISIDIGSAVLLWAATR